MRGLCPLNCSIYTSYLFYIIFKITGKGCTLENLKIIIDSLPHLLKGTLVTLELAFFSIVLGFVVSIIVALGQLYGTSLFVPFFYFTKDYCEVFLN
jgi:ABC-type amino acid transport system permease subunit